MEKKMQFKTINFAGNNIVAVNVDSLPNYKANKLGANKSIPQILYRDAYWVPIQGIIDMEAAERNVKLNTDNIEAYYRDYLREDNEPCELELYLDRYWSIKQLACLFAVFNIPEEEDCLTYVPADNKMVMKIGKV